MSSAVVYYSLAVGKLLFTASLLSAVIYNDLQPVVLKSLSAVNVFFTVSYVIAKLLNAEGDEHPPGIDAQVKQPLSDTAQDHGR